MSSCVHDRMSARQTGLFAASFLSGTSPLGVRYASRVYNQDLQKYIFLVLLLLFLLQDSPCENSVYYFCSCSYYVTIWPPMKTSRPAAAPT